MHEASVRGSVARSDVHLPNSLGMSRTRGTSRLYMVCQLPCRLHQDNGRSKQATLYALHRQGGSGDSIHSWHWPGHCYAPGARGSQGACLQQLAMAAAAPLCPAFGNLAQRVQPLPRRDLLACRVAPRLRHAAGLQQALHVQQLVDGQTTGLSAAGAVVRQAVPAVPELCIVPGRQLPADEPAQVENQLLRLLPVTWCWKWCRWSFARASRRM